ncbi:hypothetical protein NUU61_002233 [Penicillium alfredii]|uniref:Lysine-specific metallo-endopeptidase domain-containing protein n=1 Tax=Penicillium alfredii TaxID=1506179 RepID=A0A9W9FR41_9EURO|nr:uncharacterized protein NUU61_002233 [Penicillium alfredii]KAJ5104886.1 hypothetical protein NUU61_002233 [Penicillium alfredii]
MLARFLILFLLVITTFASPARPKFKKGLVKRKIPNISATEFPGTRRQQVIDGFRDAFKLADAISDMPESVSKTIVKNWFNEIDYDKVKRSYDKILGGAKGTSGRDLQEGNPMLAQIHVLSDRHPQYKAECQRQASKPGSQLGAFLKDGHTSTPTMVICDAAFYTGGIDKSYDCIEAVTCASIGREVSLSMLTLGSTILHELTHWANIMYDVATEDLTKSMQDARFGNTALGTSKENAYKNAQSYEWCANQLFWTWKCELPYA